MTSPTHRWTARLPGLAVALVAAALGWLVNRSVPLLSPLLVALVLGVLVGNVGPRSLRSSLSGTGRLRPGLAYAAKPLLRLGIVLLGLQISFGAVLGLGFPMIGAVVAVTGVTFLVTTWLARRMGLRSELGLVVAAGCSICGAAAIAGMSGPAGAEEDDVASAVGIITLFGLIAIPVIPLAATGLRLSPEVAGAWVGASIHEVAQVVAAGGTLGAAALATAVIVKLTRVLLLAPMVAAVTVVRHRGSAADRPPLIPLFVLGFLAAVAVRSLVAIPAPVLAAAGIAQTILLAVSMFALGAGVNVRDLVTSGGRAVMLGAASSVFIAAAGLAAAVVVG